MPVHFKKSTGWVAATGVHFKKSTGWVAASAAYIKKAAGWAQVWPSTLTPYPIGAINIRDYLDTNVIDNVTYIANVGDTIYGHRGSAATNWENSPTSFEYRWYWSTSESGVYQAFSPAQTSTTHPTPLDTTAYITAWNDRWIRYQVRANNSSGWSAWFSSDNAAHLVKYLPVNLTNSITGTTTDGSTLTANSTWSNTLFNTNDRSPASYAYLWMYEDGSAAANTNTNSTYVLDADDVDKKLKVRITATNSGGSTEVTTALTATITAGLGAFTINNVTKTDGSAATVTLNNPTFDSSTQKISFSYSGADAYQTAAWGAAFSPDGSSASPARGPFTTLNTSDTWYYDEAGVATIGVRGSSPVAKANVSWGASSGAAAYEVSFTLGGFSSTSGYLIGQTSWSLTVLDGSEFILVSVIAYQNSNGTGLTKTGTMPSTTTVTPAQTFGSYTTKDVTVTMPFVTPTWGGSNPTWNSNNFQRTTQLTSTTGRRLASNQAYVYHSGNNNLAVGASVTIAGLGTTFNGTYTIGAVGSDANGSYIRYSRTATNVAYAANTSGTISATSGLRWGWTNGTRTWLGSVDTADYGWYWEVATSTSVGYGNWGGGWKQYSTTDQGTLVNSTAYKYVIFSNAAETGVIYGSTTARYGRVQTFSKGTDGNYYYNDSNWTGYI